MTTNSSVDIGSTSITTLGTISTGTWSATNIALNKGGTNASLTASNGGIFYSTASAGAILAGTATANQLLLSGASTTPAWSTATYPATTTINQILYSSAANTVTGLATANNGVLQTNGSGVPSIGNAIVGVGGTGNTTFTAYSVICAGTTATGSFQNVVGLGSSGNVLTSNGAGALPTWQAAGAGSVAAGTTFNLQSTTTTARTTTTSSTLVDISGLSVSITPTSSSSKVHIIANVSYGTSAGFTCQFVLLRGVTQICIGDASGSETRSTVSGRVEASTVTNVVAFNFVDSPATTSATTYKLQMQVQSTGTLSINGDVNNGSSATESTATSTITVMEVHS